MLAHYANGYWRLENGYLDETSNDNDLTATNSPIFYQDVPFEGKRAGTSRRLLVGMGS